MFLPITMITAVDSLDEAHAPGQRRGIWPHRRLLWLQERSQWFFENIEAGVTYANRPQGSTTGAWPGFQPFGGWKGSGSTGKNGGGLYYVPLYMHEQIRTLVEKAR